MNLPLQNRQPLLIIIVLTLGLATVYSIPYCVPVHDGISFSYMVGFSNHTAILLVLIFLASYSAAFGDRQRSPRFTSIVEKVVELTKGKDAKQHLIDLASEIWVYAEPILRHCSETESTNPSKNRMSSPQTT